MNNICPNCKMCIQRWMTVYHFSWFLDFVKSYFCWAKVNHWALTSNHFWFWPSIFYVLTKTFTSKYIDRYFQNVTIKPYKELFSILCYVNTRSLNDIIVSVSLIMRIIVLNEFRLHRLSGVSSMSRSRWGCRGFHLDLFQCQSHVHVEFLFV